MFAAQTALSNFDVPNLSNAAYSVAVLGTFEPVHRCIGEWLSMDPNGISLAQGADPPPESALEFGGLRC